jgi:hypothetical protein
MEYNYEREGAWKDLPKDSGAVAFAAMSGTDPAT